MPSAHASRPSPQRSRAGRRSAGSAPPPPPGQHLRSRAVSAPASDRSAGSRRRTPARRSARWTRPSNTTSPACSAAFSAASSASRPGLAAAGRRHAVLPPRAGSGPAPGPHGPATARPPPRTPRRCVRAGDRRLRPSAETGRRAAGALPGVQGAADRRERMGAVPVDRWLARSNAAHRAVTRPSPPTSERPPPPAGAAALSGWPSSQATSRSTQSSAAVGTAPGRRRSASSRVRASANPPVSASASATAASAYARACPGSVRSSRSTPTRATPSRSLPRSAPHHRPAARKRVCQL